MPIIMDEDDRPSWLTQQWNMTCLLLIHAESYRKDSTRILYGGRNNATSSGVQIFRNDEKVRQRHLPKMYTLVVTMNWNRFRKFFRIRFCFFYNRSELSQYIVQQIKKPDPAPISAGVGDHMTSNSCYANSGNHRGLGQLLTGSCGIYLLFHQLLDRSRLNKVKVGNAATTREWRGGFYGQQPFFLGEMQGGSVGVPSWGNKVVAGKLCFDFNGSGCARPRCKFNHKCAQCGMIDHGALKCGK